MAIPVKLEAFEGPLDLLLHLIEKNKVDIYDIPIVLITEQYMDYIRQMEREDMNVMSEFLVMAATLIDIKCRMLLPKEETGDEEEELDPRAELVEKLLEYKMYKQMSYELRDLSLDAGRSFYKNQTLPPEVADYRYPIDYDELVGNLNLSRLHTIFKEVIKRRDDRVDPIRSQYGRIEKDEVNIEEKSSYIEAYIHSHKVMNFRDLIERQGSRMEIIVTFLVVLELIKTGKVEISQEDTFGEISIISKVSA